MALASAWPEAKIGKLYVIKTGHPPCSKLVAVP